MREGNQRALALQQRHGSNVGELRGARHQEGGAEEHGAMALEGLHGAVHRLGHNVQKLAAKRLAGLRQVVRKVAKRVIRLAKHDCCATWSQH